MLSLENKEKIEQLLNEAMLSDIPKHLCVALSIIRSEVDGYMYGGCLCTLNERYQFINNYIKWYEKIKN